MPLFSDIVDYMSPFNKSTYQRELDSATTAHDRNKEMFGMESSFNSAEAQKARDWQEYMSNTASQRSAADLEKAGINRLLAGHNPASTPSGSSAQASAGQSPKADVSSTSNSGLQALKFGLGFINHLNPVSSDNLNSKLDALSKVTGIMTAAQQLTPPKRNKVGFS